MSVTKIFYNNGAGNVTITGSTFATSGDNLNILSGGTVTFAGTNILGSTVYGDGAVNIEADAVLDFTGNQNATVINVGAIQVLSGGTASVIAYDGSTVSVTGSGTSLANDGTLS